MSAHGQPLDDADEALFYMGALAALTMVIAGGDPQTLLAEGMAHSATSLARL
jgi:hypothetical protein